MNNAPRVPDPCDRVKMSPRAFARVSPHPPLYPDAPDGASRVDLLDALAWLMRFPDGATGADLIASTATSAEARERTLSAWRASAPTDGVEVVDPLILYVQEYGVAVGLTEPSGTGSTLEQLWKLTPRGSQVISSWLAIHGVVARPTPVPEPTTANAPARQSEDPNLLAIRAQANHRYGGWLNWCVYDAGAVVRILSCSSVKLERPALYAGQFLVYIDEGATFEEIEPELKRVHDSHLFRFAGMTPAGELAFVDRDMEWPFDDWGSLVGDVGNLAPPGTEVVVRHGCNRVFLRGDQHVLQELLAKVTSPRTDSHGQPCPADFAPLHLFNGDK